MNDPVGAVIIPPCQDRQAWQRFQVSVEEGPVRIINVLPGDNAAEIIAWWCKLWIVGNSSSTVSPLTLGVCCPEDPELAGQVYSRLMLTLFVK